MGRGKDRRRRDRSRDIDDFFYDLERIIDEMIREIWGYKGFTDNRPLVYGYSVIIGPDGELGLKRQYGKPRIEEMGPLIDVFELGEEVIVVTELPGVSGDEIKVEVSEDGRSLIIRAEGGRRYYRAIRLPARVDPSSVNTRYKNSVLEVKLKKKKSDQQVDAHAHQ